MAITSVKELFDERDSADTVDDRTYTRKFQVVVDDPFTQATAIFANSTIPSLYTEHPDDPTVVVIGRFPKPRLGRLIWDVVVKYRRKQFVNIEIGTSGSGTINPVDLPPDISYSFTQYSRAVEQAYLFGLDPADNPTIAIENSSSMPFDPPLTQEESNLVINIVRNESGEDFDPLFLITFNNTINAFNITIAGIVMETFEARMRNIGSVKKWDEDGEAYWRVTYEIEVDFATHLKSLLDIGFYTEDIITGVHTAILDAEGNPITEPVKLDGAGGQLPVGGDPIYLDFNTYFALDWTNLNLPINEEE